MSMIDEREIVGSDYLERNRLQFSVEGSCVISPDPDDPGYEQTDYIVALTCLDSGKRTTWCQGWDNLDFDYFNEYKDLLS